MEQRRIALPKCWRKYPEASYDDERRFIPSEQFLDLDEGAQQHYVRMVGSFAYYMGAFWLPEVCRSDHRTVPETLPDHVAEWCEILQYRLPQHASRAVMIQAPTGHLKTITMQGFAAWAIGNDPDLWIMVMMNTLDNAPRWTGGIMQQLKHPHFRGVFGDLAPEIGEVSEFGDRRDRSAQRLTVKRNIPARDPTVLVVSPDTRFRGVRCHWFIADDFQDEDNCRTPKQIASLHEKLGQAARRQNKHPDPWKCMTIYICTPAAHGDPSMRIRAEVEKSPTEAPLGVAYEAYANARWMVYRYPAVMPNADGETFPTLKDGTQNYLRENESGEWEPRREQFKSEPKVLWPMYQQSAPDPIGAFASLMSEVAPGEDDALASGWHDFWRNRMLEPVNPAHQSMGFPSIQDKSLADGGRRSDGQQRPKLILWNRSIPEPKSLLYEMYAEAGFDPAHCRRVVTCDLAFAEKTTTTDPDYTVLQLWLLNRENQSVIVDMERFQGTKPAPFQALVQTWHQGYRPDRIVVEGNALQSYVAADIEEHLGLPPGVVRNPLNRKTKEQLKSSIAFHIDRALLLIPWGDAATIEVMRPLVTELSAFPSGTHDDTVDACALHLDEHGSLGHEAVVHLIAPPAQMLMERVRRELGSSMGPFVGIGNEQAVEVLGAPRRATPEEAQREQELGLVVPADREVLEIVRGVRARMQQAVRSA